MKRRSLYLVPLWVVLVVVGLLLISSYQQQQFLAQLEENMSELNEELKNASTELQEKWESLDKESPEEILDYFELEISAAYLAYLIDFHEYLYEQENNPFTGTFTTQANEGAFVEGYFIILLAHVDGQEELHAGSEYCNLFVDHAQKFKEGHQVFSWEAFKDSDEWRKFLEESHQFFENKKEITLQETYQQIEDLKKTAPKRNSYQRTLVQMYAYLTETYYHSYQTHKNQNDFIGALLDAEVVYSIYEFSRHIETREIFTTTFTPYQQGSIYVHSSILDLAFVLILSTFIVVGAWVLMKVMGTSVD